MFESTDSLTLEDLGTSIDLIRQLIDEWQFQHDDPPAVATAAIIMLSQARDFFNELDYVIKQKIGRLSVVVPDHLGLSWFARKNERMHRVIDVHLEPNDDFKASLAD